MAKYSDRLVEKIVRLIEEDTYTISEICDALRISRNTFYEWKSTKPEFSQALEDAEARRDSSLAILARRSLREQLEGYVEITEKIVYQDDGYDGQTMKSKTVTKKKVAAKASVIKLALEHSDSKKEESNKKGNIHPATRTKEEIILSLKNRSGVYRNSQTYISPNTRMRKQEVNV
ncbi:MULTISPECIES: transposase [Dysgonomonas]|uniref:transposase n=1 Tax=Dysgonomonas TaxID=156973 RepID=UPI00067FD90A|nr:transposase [Dysgonomonas sp. BGC7]MBD8387578.1 transposase [Dysgonomonas sp. BGC7]